MGLDAPVMLAKESSMMQHVGLDVADEETSVCVVDQEGAVLVEAKVASEPAASRHSSVHGPRRQ
jgi:hypothetical protein